MTFDLPLFMHKASKTSVYLTLIVENQLEKSSLKLFNFENKQLSIELLNINL